MRFEASESRRSTASQELARPSVQQLPSYDSISIKSKKATRRCARFQKTDKNMLLLTILAVLLGVMTGMLLRKTNPSLKVIMVFNFFGDLMLRMLKMLMIPLLVSTLVSGITSLAPGSSTKMTIITAVYYIVRTLLAVIVGLILVIFIHPGSPNAIKTEQSSNELFDVDSHLISYVDWLRNIIPDNIVTTCFQQKKMYIDYTTNETYNDGQSWRLVNKFKKTKVDVPNAIGLVSVSLFFGAVLRNMPEKGKMLVQLVKVLNDVVIVMNRAVMWYTPVGIYFLITAKLLEDKYLMSTMRNMVFFVITVTSGQLIHSLITLNLIYLVLTRKNSLIFFKGMFQAWLTALSTASSSATLPVTLKCLEGNLKIHRRITRFVLPIGATINMDGTALYEAVAFIFIAQINKMALNFSQIIITCSTVTLVAMGATSVPGARLITLVTVLDSVNLPFNDIPLILAVDWLLDRIRTSINVLGDAVGACIVAHLCSEQVKEDANPLNYSTDAAIFKATASEIEAPPLDNDDSTTLNIIR